MELRNRFRGLDSASLCTLTGRNVLCGPERQIWLSYRPARIHRLAKESIPGVLTLNVYKIGLRRGSYLFLELFILSKYLVLSRVVLGWPSPFKNPPLGPEWCRLGRGACLHITSKFWQLPMLFQMFVGTMQCSSSSFNSTSMELL